MPKEWISAGAEIAAEATPPAPAPKTETVSTQEIGAVEELLLRIGEKTKEVSQKALTKGLETLSPLMLNKLSRGLGVAGFEVEKWKDTILAEGLEKAQSKLQKEGTHLAESGTAVRFIAGLKKQYLEDAKKAEQGLEGIKKNEAISAAGGTARLAGNVIRYARTFGDVFGWTAAAPLRYVMLGSMWLSRGADAAKEARLQNQVVIEKTRLDLDAALDETEKLYASDLRSGSKKLSGAEIEKRYTAEIPKDLKERLEKNEAPGMLTGLAERMSARYIERGLRHLNWKLARIENDQKLSPKAKEVQIAKLYESYKKGLHDFDRMVARNGEIDLLAVGAAATGKLAKGVVYAMTLQSAAVLLKKGWEFFSPSRAEAAELSPASTITKPAIKPEEFKTPTIKVDFEESIPAGGSFWQTTRSLLESHSKDMGFDGDASDTKALRAWAEGKTRELMANYAGGHGGAVPDLVHEGDKVIVDKDTGALQLISESGETPSYLPDIVAGNDQLKLPQGYDFGAGFKSSHEVMSSLGDKGIDIELADGKHIQIYDWDRDGNPNIILPDGTSKEMTIEEYRAFMQEQGIFNPIAETAPAAPATTPAPVEPEKPTPEQASPPKQEIPEQFLKWRELASEQIIKELQRGKWYWFGDGARSQVLTDNMYKIMRSFGARRDQADHFINWISGKNGVLDSGDFEKLGFIKNKKISDWDILQRAVDFQRVAGSKQLPEENFWVPRIVHYKDGAGEMTERLVSIRKKGNNYEIDYIGTGKVQEKIKAEELEKMMKPDGDAPATVEPPPAAATPAEPKVPSAEHPESAPAPEQSPPASQPDEFEQMTGTISGRLQLLERAMPQQVDLGNDFGLVRLRLSNDHYQDLIVDRKGDYLMWLDEKTSTVKGFHRQQMLEKGWWLDNPEQEIPLTKAKPQSLAALTKVYGEKEINRILEKEKTP